MELTISQVGKRWFIVCGKEVQVEATYEIWEDWKDDWKRKKRWVVTGKGSKRYRVQIVEALEEYLRTQTVRSPNHEQ